MKRTLLLLFALLSFSAVFSKSDNCALMASMDATLVADSLTDGQLHFTLTLTNTGDELLFNISLSFTSGITFNMSPQPLGPGQILILEGTKPFSGCYDNSIVEISATTMSGDLVVPLPAICEFINTSAAAPLITSVITPDCYQVPVTGNMQVSLSGLPSGNWTLHGSNSSNYTYSGSGSTAVLDLSPTTISSGISFYYDAPDGCPSASTAIIVINEIHNFDNNAPMDASYIDSNSNGIVDVGDQILYQIMVKNTRACSLDDVRINGLGSSVYNYNLSFSGNLNTTVNVPGYTTLAVAATYNLTQIDIDNGYVVNITSVNPHWSDALGGTSALYYPICTLNLNALGANELSFQNFTAYPNPVDNLWKIANGLSIEKVEIMTVLGQYVRSIRVHDLKAEIDLSDLNSGTYIARVYAGQKIKSIKIIKS